MKAQVTSFKRQDIFPLLNSLQVTTTVYFLISCPADSADFYPQITADFNIKISAQSAIKSASICGNLYRRIDAVQECDAREVY